SFSHANTVTQEYNTDGKKDQNIIIFDKRSTRDKDPPSLEQEEQPLPPLPLSPPLPPLEQEQQPPSSPDQPLPDQSPPPPMYVVYERR
ncbi:8756_t:CDS:2, partial [Rhizophagus irregularis]